MDFGDQYNKAVSLIKEAYQENLELVTDNDVTYPKEYLYAIRMIEVLKDYAPKAIEEVYLAAWCQHLYRWEIPRNSYPMDRKGYHQWRTYLYTYQANKAETLLLESGYSAESIHSVKNMIEKKDLDSNKDSQLLEDVVCLVFLQYYILDFITKHKEDENKLKRIILSTWLKMSDKAHEEALKINYDDTIKQLIISAVES